MCPRASPRIPHPASHLLLLISVFWVVVAVLPPGPDYLDVIKKPVDLQHIKTGLKRGDYRDLNAFAADCHLVFDNAIL